MHSTARVVKVSAILLVFAVFIVGGMAANVKAGPLFQATSDASATMNATTDTTGGTGSSLNATMNATTSAGGSTGSTSPVFALCPPLNSVVATASANTGNTSSATMQASSVNTTGTGPGYLGVQAAANDSCGVSVVQVFNNSPAMVAGVQTGDVIVAINCVPLTAMFAMNTVGGTTGTSGTNSTSGTTGTTSGSNPSSAATTPAMSATQSAMLTDCSSMAGGTAGSTAGMSATESASTQTAGGTGGSSAGQPVTSFVVVSSFFRAIESNPPGTQLLLTLDRNGEEMNIPVTLGVMPPGVQPFFNGPVATFEPTNVFVTQVAPTPAPGNPAPASTAPEAPTSVVPTSAATSSTGGTTGTGATSVATSAATP